MLLSVESRLHGAANEHGAANANSQSDQCQQGAFAKNQPHDVLLAGPRAMRNPISCVRWDTAKAISP